MSPSARESRPFDLVLFGATGFTGRLVAEYLAGPRVRPPGFGFALGGRHLEKLERVRADLVALDPSLAALPLLVADSGDPASLDALARQSRVVCSTVGPYAKHGRALIAACAEHGTDYCDLSGEVPFVRDAIDRLDGRARETGARLVPSCGFDSVPSDLGVFLLHQHFAARGSRLAGAKLYAERLRGGLSGGTIASMLNLAEEARRDPEVRRLVADPYALDPDRGRDRGPDRRDQMGVAWDREARCWTAPFVMAAVNTRVVRRSNALLGYPYGHDFRYAEVTSFPRGPRGFARAAALTAGLGAFLTLASAGATRRLLARALPAPGEGPSRARREGGSFRLRLLGRSAPAAGDAGQVARAELVVESPIDPGYGATAKIIGEAALCLARDDLPSRGGLLTPAACLGTRLVERLRRAGITWELRDLPGA